MIFTRPAWSTDLPAIRGCRLVCGSDDVNIPFPMGAKVLANDKEGRNRFAHVHELAMRCADVRLIGFP